MYAAKYSGRNRVGVDDPERGEPSIMTGKGASTPSKSLLPATTHGLNGGEPKTVS